VPVKLAKFWQQWFGSAPPTAAEPPPRVEPLSDSDCDFLFTQVLEGVSHGWDSHRLQRFFARTGDRADITHWVNWLNRYGAKVLSAPVPDLELAKRLDRFAVQVQHLPGLLEMGAAAYAIATQLRERQIDGAVWEYDGPDSILGAGTPDEPLTAADRPGVEPLTLEELFERLRQDPELRRRIAAQVGIDSDDPLVIVQALATKLRPLGT